MKKVIALGAVVMLMVLALAAEATPVGLDDAEGQAFPGKRVIEVQGSAALDTRSSPAGTGRRPGGLTTPARMLRLSVVSHTGCCSL